MIKLLFSLLILNLLIFFNINKISKIINIYDKPDNKLKIHKSIIPLLGGFIIISNLFLFIFIICIFDSGIIKINFSIRENISICFFVFSFFLLGIIDDKYKLNPEKKFFISIFSSILVITLNQELLITNLKFSFFENRFFLNDFSYFFTIFCIIILVNALNFYDGINGQSITFFIIIFGYLTLVSQNFIFYPFIIFCLIFVLILNLKNKIFMGDNGIYLLSSVLILSLIYEYNEFKTIKFADEIFFLLILPGYDLLRLTVTRVFMGRNPFYGDRNHIHHLIKNRFSLLKTNMILIFLILLPILLFNYAGMHFLIVLAIFTFIYIFLITKLSKNDKKYYYRKNK